MKSSRDNTRLLRTWREKHDKKMGTFNLNDSYLGIGPLNLGNVKQDTPIFHW